MTEMITIVAVGIGLAGLILNGQRNIREDIKGLEPLEKLRRADRACWSVNREVGRIA